MSSMKHKYKNIKICLILNFVEFDFHGMTRCPVIARMVLSDFSHVCIELIKGFEIPRSHNNAGEYLSILGCHAVPTCQILQTCLRTVLPPTSASIIPKDPSNEKL